MNPNTNPDDANQVPHGQPAAPKYPPAPPSISGRSTASFNPHIPPPMSQPGFMPPMPPMPQMEWWNPYQMPPLPFDDNNQAKKNPSGKQMNQMNQMNQFMDPAYMYYMMAAAAASAYPPPFGYPPYGTYPYPPPQMNQSRFYQDDDQRSIKSFLDIDNRSEQQFEQNKARSIAGDQPLKLKQSPPGLLMPEQKINEELENLNLNQSQFIKQEDALVRDQEKVNRMTPMLHQLPHVRCSFSFNGILRVRPNDPCDGQPALVDVFNLSDFMENYLSNVKKSGAEQQENENEYKHDLDDFNYMNDDVRNEILTNYKLLQEFPGPLSKELNTSKAQVIQFCLKNVKECLWSSTSLIDPQSHALLWDFLALLVRQNGLVDLKTDISPLLLSGLVENSDSVLKSAESSQALNQAQDFVMVKQKEEESSVREEEANLNRLRQLLGAGQKSEAIDYTIKHNMWPHSLFLASSSFNSLTQTQSLGDTKPNLTNIANPFNESKILTKVKLRFISSLPQNDPIITCYQLLMGRVPTAASNLSKSEWNEWRRHLAMIVSNVDETNQHLVLNTIKTMGDSLASNGRIAASHFCYLLSNCLFGTYDKKSSKLVLIGSSHNQEFSKFCQISAIQATEIFEYAQSLLNSTQFNSDNFLKYKLIYANKLLEHGLMNEAYKYIEVIAKTVNNNPAKHADKLSSVYHLANRLKIYDPDYFNLDETSQFQEPVFITQLAQNFSNLYSNNISHLISQQPQLYENRMEPKMEQISFVEPHNQQPNYQPQIEQQIYQPQVEQPVYQPQIEQQIYQPQVEQPGYEAQHSLPFQPSQEQNQNAMSVETGQNHQQNIYPDYQNYNYQAPVDLYQPSQAQVPASRKSSINSLHQQPLNYMPNDQPNYQQYQQPVYSQSRSRASSTSNSNESNLIAPQVYDPTKSMGNFYQPIFTPEVTSGIAEEPAKEKKEQEPDDDLSVANPKFKNDNQDEIKTDVAKKPDEAKKGSLWDWFKKPAGPKKMILPDDKKKTIVWDDKLKKYVNKDESASGSAESVKPPPISVPNQPMPNVSADATNKFSLRNTNTKRPSNYYAKLDIMADKSKKMPPNGGQSDNQPLVSNLPPPSQLPPRFFVPAPDPTHQQAMYFNPGSDPQSNN